MARPTKAKAIERLQKALGTIPELRQLPYDSPEFTKWRRDTRTAITNTFGDKLSHTSEFNTINYTPNIDPVAIALFSKDKTRTPSSISQKAYMRGLDLAASVLESMLDEVKEYWPPPTANDVLRAYEELGKEHQEDKNQTPLPSTAQGNEQTNTNEVFIVHGRDNEAKETVARFLENLDLKAVILHEQSNQGRTIIEKFEQHAQVGFAVALLTPDDVGALQDNSNDLKPRARQNVVFELGYFLGRLGRERVCALTKGDVEIPSDYAGVVYIPLDDFGGWKMKLIEELRNVFDVDANKL